MGSLEILQQCPQFKSDNILKSIVKGYSIINNPAYKTIICSISGGSDSDIMIDLIYKIDVNHKVKYVWFDTGLEYQATKDHLKYLENRYNIIIHREKAVKPIPLCVREYGQPFLSKEISEHIQNLQNNNFDWKDYEFDEMIQKFPRCKSSAKWWCNTHSENNRMHDIRYRKYLKDFLIANPPTFKISKKCCYWAKKKVSHNLIKKYKVDLMIIGVRKSEGGVRGMAYQNCYTPGENQYRPLFWFTDADKQIYKDAFKIKNSDCYER